MASQTYSSPGSYQLPINGKRSVTFVVENAGNDGGSRWRAEGFIENSLLAGKTQFNIAIGTADTSIDTELVIDGAITIVQMEGGAGGEPAVGAGAGYEITNVTELPPNDLAHGRVTLTWSGLAGIHNSPMFVFPPLMQGL